MLDITAMLPRSLPSCSDDIRLVDSIPGECGRSPQTAKRSDLAGWATYGYSASRSRYFWGPRLHHITTPSGLPARLLDNETTSQPGPARSLTAYDH